jgi:HSP20 family protein
VVVKMFGPLVEIARLQNEVNRIFESLLNYSPEDSLKAASGWVPNVDVSQTARAVTVTVELPGVDPERVRLAASAGQLTVSGEKPRGGAVKGARYHCLERSYGAFTRTVNLPVPVNTHQAQATLRAGLLTVSFPRVPNRRGEAVDIPVGTE